GGDLGGDGRQVFVRHPRRLAEAQVLLGDVATRRDVGGLDHGDDVRVRMRDVRAGEHESDAFRVVPASQDRRELARDAEDLGGEVGRQVVEVGVVRLRYDDHMAAPDRMNVQESEDAIRFVDDMRGQCLRADAAEEAAGRIVPAWLDGRFLAHLAVPSLQESWSSTASTFATTGSSAIRRRWSAT